MNRINSLTFIVLTALTISCTGVTEPMPDIPETVEYDTIRIEYGEDDLLLQTNPGMLGQGLVGDSSDLAALTRAIVRGTNRTIRDHLNLVEAIVAYPPSYYEDDVWAWQLEQEEKFTFFAIQKMSEDRFRYILRSGPSEDEALDIFGGDFTRFERLDGAQQGFGAIYFDFDNMKLLDPESGPESGKVVIAFRAVNRIRQVRVALFDFRERGGDNASTALYEYTQLRNAGRFKYSTLADFSKDGAPLERMTLDTAWTPGGEGRAAARVTGGSLLINEFLMDECWDANGAIVWADARPDVPNYDDGDESACARGLTAVDLTAPNYVAPSADPEVPGPHPDE